MKKVFQIKCVGVYGGAGMGEYIGQEAMKSGWESYIAFARVLLPTKSKFVKIGNKWSLYEHVLESRIFDNSGFASRVATKKLIKQIREISPDIIHLHNIHGYYLNVKILFEFLSESGIPVIWTFHDCWPITGHCSYFVSANCDKWKTQCYECPLSRSYPTSWFLDRSRSNYGIKKRLFIAPRKMHIVTVSKWLEQVLRESFLKEKDIRTIYNGIDLEVFKPQRRSENHGLFIILGVAANWEKRKGIDDYLELSHYLKEDERIMLVGVNDELAKRLPNNIIPINRTNDLNQLSQLYSNADVVTSLSYAETFGMTIAEGYACGIPVIVYNNTAQPELVSDKTGFVVEEGNIANVYSAIQRIKNMDQRERIQLKVNCRSVAESKFNKNVLYQDYIKLYEEALRQETSPNKN